MDWIIIGAGSTHNKREFRFPFRQFPVMFGLSPDKLLPGVREVALAQMFSIMLVSYAMRQTPINIRNKHWMKRK